MDVKEAASNRYFLTAAALLAVLVTGFLVQGFSSTVGAQQSASLSYDAGVPTAAGGGGDSARQLESAERKRITTARIDIDVESVEDAQADIQSMAASYNGFVTDTSLSREFGDRGNMEVRVPEENLSAFMSDAGERWRVDSRSISHQDVTQRYTELTLELDNKRQEMQRLQELMNRTDDVENLIKIQERMGELRTRIQYLENQLNQLDERIEYATVHIQMEEASAFESRFELRRAFTDAYRGVFKSVNLMIVGTGYLLPFAVLLALLYLGKRKWE